MTLLNDLALKRLSNFDCEYISRVCKGKISAAFTWILSLKIYFRLKKN